MRALFPFCSSLAGTPALADANEITVGMTTRALRSSSANAVTGDSYIGGQLAFRASPARRTRSPRRGDRALAWAGADGTLFDMTTELERVPRRCARRTRWCRISRRCGGAGRCRTHVASLTDAMDRTVSDHGSAHRAGRARPPSARRRRRSLQAGCASELGYVAAAAVGLAGKSARPNDGTLRLQMTRRASAASPSADRTPRFPSSATSDVRCRLAPRHQSTGCDGDPASDRQRAGPHPSTSRSSTCKSEEDLRVRGARPHEGAGVRRPSGAVRRRGRRGPPPASSAGCSGRCRSRAATRTRCSSTSIPPSSTRTGSSSPTIRSSSTSKTSSSRSPRPCR